MLFLGLIVYTMHCSALATVKPNCLVVCSEFALSISTFKNQTTHTLVSYYSTDVKLGSNQLPSDIGALIQCKYLHAIKFKCHVCYISKHNYLIILFNSNKEYISIQKDADSNDDICCEQRFSCAPFSSKQQRV